MIKYADTNKVHSTITAERKQQTKENIEYSQLNHKFPKYTQILKNENKAK